MDSKQKVRSIIKVDKSTPPFNSTTTLPFSVLTASSTNYSSNLSPSFENLTDCQTIPFCLYRLCHAVFQ